MKKTTYIILALVALTFITNIAIFVYISSHAITREEYEALHPEFFSNVSVTEEIYYDPDDAFTVETEEPEQRPATVINAATGQSLNVVVTGTETTSGEEFYTDTLIIVSPKRDIRVIVD